MFLVGLATTCIVFFGDWNVHTPQAAQVMCQRPEAVARWRDGRVILWVGSFKLDDIGGNWINVTQVLLEPTGRRVLPASNLTRGNSGGCALSDWRFAVCGGFHDGAETQSARR